MSVIYKHLSEYLGMKQDRPAPNNQVHTRITRDPYDCIHVVYHYTKVVSVDSLGNITLRTGGWETRTTMARMETILDLFNIEKHCEPNGWHRVHITGSITTYRGKPKNYRPWLVVARCCELEQTVAQFTNGVARFSEADILPCGSTNATYYATLT
jgi:hypothetical protein